MSKRKSLSKKIRFEIFKRDSFTCQYCGNTPPKVVLEVDHIVPVSKGGDNEINNLLCSCFDCNRGKKDIKLNCIPSALADNMKILKEKQEQIKEYEKLLKRIKNKSKRDIKKINDIYSSYFDEYILNKRFQNGSLRKFLDKLIITDVEDAMHKACSFINDPDDSIKYFCGICWNMIRGDE